MTDFSLLSIATFRLVQVQTPHVLQGPPQGGIRHISRLASLRAIWRFRTSSEGAYDIVTDILNAGLGKFPPRKVAAFQ